MNFNSISVIGLGYIGLPTAATLASRRKHVIGVDKSEHAVNTINSGNIHIVEPELDIIVHSTVHEGFLRATSTVEPADAFIVAVPTPFKNDHEPDLSYIKEATQAIAPHLAKGNLIILESTSPVGTTEKMEQWIQELRADLTFPSQVGDTSDIRLAYCPERVLPGNVVRELVENDRIIGGITPECAQSAYKLYSLFVKGELLITNARTAEMCKLTENAFRDVNIAFANELSMICDQQSINVWELINAANHHPRVNILNPGCGVGGHCIAIDPWFIIHNSPDQATLIHTARQVNDHKPKWVIDQINKTIGEYLVKHPDKTAAEVKIACLGLTFKPNIDDLRESPALKIAKEVKNNYKQVFCVEPNIENERLQNEHDLTNISLEIALETCEVLVLLTMHTEFAISEKIKQFPYVINYGGQFA